MISKHPSIPVYRCFNINERPPPVNCREMPFLFNCVPNTRFYVTLKTVLVILSAILVDIDGGFCTIQRRTRNLYLLISHPQLVGWVTEKSLLIGRARFEYLKILFPFRCCDRVNSSEGLGCRFEVSFLSFLFLGHS